MNCKDMEACGYILTEAVSWHLHGGTEENHENPLSH